MKVIIYWGRNMEQEHLNGQIIQGILLILKLFILGTKDNSKKIIFMDMEFISGVMGENMLESGKLIRCMGKALLPGRMVESIQENIKWTRNMASESFIGQMTELTKENGNMVNIMEKEYL